MEQLDHALGITIVAPYDGDAVPELGGFDSVVFTGSGVEWSTDDPRAEPIAQIMRDTLAAGLPAFGSCNGMQLAASVLGGSSDISPNGREDGLALGINLTDAGRAHPMMQGRKDGYAVPCVHRDEVVKLPDGAVVLAQNDHSPVQAFAYERNGARFWGVQYHPEFDPSDVAKMMGTATFDPQQIADMHSAKDDAQAAARLGTTPQDQRPETRMTELRNWLAQL